MSLKLLMGDTFIDNVVYIDAIQNNRYIGPIFYIKIAYCRSHKFCKCLYQTLSDVRIYWHYSLP